MSFKKPSYVSPTTGRHHEAFGSRSISAATSASRTSPTWCVLVIPIGPLNKPDSSSQWEPVISPLPLNENRPPKHRSERASTGLELTIVTPVRATRGSLRITV